MISLNKIFKIKEHCASLHIEILAGLTTFSSMAYILIVNPTILSLGGMDFGSVLTATIICTFIGSCLMALFGNLPFAIAPGMGTSTFLTFSLILTYQISWQEGLACVFLTSIALFILNIFNLRIKILNAIPLTLLNATVAGVGLFLIFVALREVNIIKPGAYGFITIGHVYSIETLLVLGGLFLTAYLEQKRIKSSFLIGILSIWVVSLMIGKAKYTGIVALPPSLSPTFFQLDFSRITHWTFWRFCFSIFLVTLFDSSAAILTLKKFLPHKISSKKQQLALYSDVIGSFIGSLIGTGSLSIHLESASGLKVGGKTGLTSLIVGLLFFLCFFFYPLISSIPTFASAPVLMIIGVLMVQELRNIDWKKLTDALPTLIVIFTMPLLFSIYLGFAYGFIAFTIMKLFSGKLKEITPLCFLLTALFALQLLLSYFLF